VGRWFQKRSLDALVQSGPRVGAFVRSHHRVDQCDTGEMPLRSMTVRVRHDVDPIALGARSGLLWSRAGFTVCGIGEAARIPLTRPDGAAVAQSALASLLGRDDVRQPGTGPLAFAALAFDPTAPGELIVPQVVVGVSADGAKWLTVIGDDDPTSDMNVEAVMARVHAVRDTPQVGPQPTSMTLRSVHTPEFWRDEVVGKGIARLNAGEARKVVLAREVTVEADAPFNTVDVIERLRQSFSSAILFAVDGLIGASPELLVARSNEIVRAHPLAGTAPRSSDPTIDQRLAAELHASTKNRYEHRVTIDWLLDTLLPFCSYVDAEPEPSIVTLANVHHLGTLVEGVLSDPAPSVLELVAALHPTPAVGGDPQGVAIMMISELEHMDRGRYAGATGWVDGAGNGAFAVNVRVAQIIGAVAHVYSGCGIVGDSDPAAELAETRTKFQAILGALIRP
jgi:isochorismate synthase